MARSAVASSHFIPFLMAKLSKREISLHDRIHDLIKKDVLTKDEKIFVYENFNEATITQVGPTGSFFTPFELATNFQIEIRTGRNSRVIDFCAGIGVLSFTLYHWSNTIYRPTEIICVEKNPEFVAIGKKLLPEATYICGDVLDEDFIASLGEFDTAYSNPPYGRIRSTTDSSWLCYKGGEFEFKVAEICARIAPTGTLLIPQNSCPFGYSGFNSYRNMASGKYTKFYEQSQLLLEPGMGIDTSIFESEWKNTNIRVEIALFDLDSQVDQGYSAFKPYDVTKENMITEAIPSGAQLSLF